MVIVKSFVEVSKCSCKCVDLSNPSKVRFLTSVGVFSLAFMKTFWIRITTTITQITTKHHKQNLSQSQSPNKDYNHEHEQRKQTKPHKNSNTNTNKTSHKHKLTIIKPQ